MQNATTTLAPTTAAAAEGRFVYAVSVESASSGMVNWFHNTEAANANFDRQIKDFEDCPGEHIKLFAVVVPQNISNQEVTDLVDEAMHKGGIPLMRSHKTTVEYVTVPACALNTIIGCADQHVDDLNTGIAEGIYSEAENADLPVKKAALAKVMGAITADESRFNDVVLDRTIVLEAHATSDHATSPDYCAVHFTKELLQKIATLSKTCEALQISQIRFDYYPESWGSEEVEECAQLNDSCIVVCQDETFWFSDLAEAYNCHFETDPITITNALEVLKAESGPIVFDSDEVKEAYYSNETDEADDPEDASEEVEA